MKNKYFTPDIEDIHVGYACEELRNGNWEFLNIPYNECLNDLYSQCLNNFIRVPYLIKEDIEDEGWEIINSEIFTYGYFLKGECKLELQEDNKICIRKGLWYPENTIYKGECKDINTFKKIIKLLGI
jgi:hypothetical protein